MASKREGWKVVQSENGTPYLTRVIGDVSGIVQKVILNGYPAWFYTAGIDEYQIAGYKDTMQSAKIAATKYMRWYALRANDFKRSKSKLRQSWLQQGIEEVEPVWGCVWDARDNKRVVDRIVWERDEGSNTWKSGAWALVWNKNRTHTLIHPDGYEQTIYRDGTYAAMDEAAYWIRLYLR